MDSLDTNYIESILVSMARKIGIEISGYRSFKDILLKIVQYPEKLEVSKELPITPKDILTFEEHLADYIAAKLWR